MPDDSKPPVPTTSPSPKLPDANKKSTPSLSPDAVSRTESKATQFFRSFLRWTGVALLVFGLGALTTIFLFYVPKSDELKQVEQDLATANATIGELQTEITTLENKIDALSTLEEANLALQDERDQVHRHVHLLDALTDIRTAQYALEKDETSAANLALADTATTLTALQTLSKDEEADIDSMLSRLELALGELDANPFAAQSDLEVLANSLIELEKTWFSEP